ncbi:Protein S-acyltransferase 8 [Hibiscus syriacus]|uniref:Protein S-acyltransferase 8 n=1 Tax=Hibiscus syriacus TaxID=106335 RepID=A0A6A2ZL52_HIBSY|nr:Protein S-acyltransferase 8 [Hibiscus syriacus]
MYRAPLSAQLTDSDLRVIDYNATPVRVYQVWKGSNKFFFGGRVIFGPDVRSIFLTISLIVIPVVLFCAFVSRRIIRAFDSYGQSHCSYSNSVNHILINVLPVKLVQDLILLLLTSGRDPGIIPRNDHPPEPEEDVSTMSTDWLGSQSSAGLPNLPPTKDVVVNGVIVKVKYCHTCMLYRPPRCSHCRYATTASSVSITIVRGWGNVSGRVSNRGRVFGYFGFTVIATVAGAIAAVAGAIAAVADAIAAVAGNSDGGETAISRPKSRSLTTTYENFRYRYDLKSTLIIAVVFATCWRHSCPKSPSLKVTSGQWSGWSHLLSLALNVIGPAYDPREAKRSFDIETGKRKPVAAEDFEEIRIRINSGSGLERCGTQPRHTIRVTNPTGISPDITVLAADFVTDYGFKDREKVRRKGH